MGKGKMSNDQVQTLANNKGVVLIMGAGDAIGSAIARKFALQGHVVCLARRNGDKLTPLIEQIEVQGGQAHGFTCDARKEEDVQDLFKKIEQNIGELDVVVFNIGANVPMSILGTSSKKFFKIWEMACFAGFLTGREAAQYMSKRKRGTIIFTGATASVRGGAVFAAFSSAKQGLKALAQSMARELGPKNIHVAHVVIDAMVDTDFIHSNFSSLVEAAGPDGIVNPDDLADNYVMLHNQPRNAWTFELDVRPWVEKW